MLEKRFVSGALFLVWLFVLILPTRQFLVQNSKSARFSNVQELYYSSGLKEYLRSPEFNSTLPGNDALLKAYDQWRIQYNKGEYSAERFDNFKVNYMTLLTANAASTRRANGVGSFGFPSYMSLNEYGDCSIEEYKKIMAAGGQSGDNSIANPAMSNVPQEQQMSEANWASIEPTGENTERVDPVMSNIPQEPQQISTSYGTVSDPVEWDVNDGESAIEKQIREEQANEYEIRLLYEAWCEEKGKPVDESRLPIFAEHYLKAIEYCAQTNKPLKLNEYADLTTEEYNSLSFRKQAQQQQESRVSSDVPKQPAPTTTFNGQQQVVEPTASFNGQQQVAEPTASFNGQQQETETTTASFREEQQPPAASFNGLQQQIEPTTAPFKQEEQPQANNVFNGQKQEPSSSKAPSQPSLNAGMSTGSYLDSISKGTVVATYFGEKPEVKEEDLASLFSKLNEAKEVEEEAKIQARRAEVAALQAGEVARIKEEEQARLTAAEEARQQSLEESRLKAWQEAKQKAEIEAEERAGLSPQDTSSDAQASPPAVPFQPLSGSYMGAVAKTWKSKSEYLAQLEASTKYLESLQDVPPSELPKMYDQLDSLTGSLPIAPSDVESKQDIPTLETVEEIWEDEKLNEEVESIVPELTEFSDATTAKMNELADATNAKVAEIKDKADVPTRRQRDEMAARKAREEAEQWMRIQKQLEEQADLARERREREEKALLEAQKRAKELEAANLERERRLKEFQAMEGKTDAKGAETIKKLQESTEKALAEAARLKEELRRLNASKPPSIISSFFASGNKGEKKAKQNIGAVKQNQQFAEAHRKRDEVLNRMAAQEEKKSFFDWFQNNPEEKSKTLASVTMWSLNKDGSITGIVERSSSFDKGVRITTSPVLGRAYEGAVVVTASGNRYQLGERVNDPVSGANAADFFLGFFDGLQKSQRAALLIDWKINKDGTLTGIVSKKKGFNDGAKITTSPVIDEEIGPGKVVQTLGGSYYRLL